MNGTVAFVSLLWFVVLFTPQIRREDTRTREEFDSDQQGASVKTLVNIFLLVLYAQLTK